MTNHKTAATTFGQILALAGLLSLAAAQASPVLLTSSAAPTLSGSTLVDFNTAALGSFTTRTFSGVTISAGGANLNITSSYSGSYGASGRSLINSGVVNPITFSFAGGVSAFGFNWGAADQAWTMQILDINDVLLSTLNIAAQTGSYSGFIGSDGLGATISSAKLFTVSGRNDIALIDNLRFVPAAANNVPEPASWALAGIGLLAAVVTGARRRRRQA